VVAVRTAPQLAELRRRLGTDLALAWAGPAGAWTDADLAVAARARGARTARDVAVTGELDETATQFLVNRLQTIRGELAPLGHPTYGSRHHELVGEPNTERTRNLVKLYVLECLREEPRIATVVRCDIVPLARYRDVVRIELVVRLIEEDTPRNLVVGFALGGGP
jgi:phage baseplate assembly protein W